MDIQQYIVRDIDPVNMQLPVRELKQLFNQLTYSHLPVMNQDVFAGCVSETDAHCFDIEKTLDEYAYALENFSVSTNSNWLDVLEAFAKNASNIMPVFDEEGTYQGYFELADIMNLFNKTPFLNERGSIIIVQKNSREASLSEIAQIAESNNAKILGVFISDLTNDQMQTTIKIKTELLNTVLQTYRRYGYSIVSSHQEDQLADNLKERSAYLDKYLNI